MLVLGREDGVNFFERLFKRRPLLRTAEFLGTERGIDIFEDGGLCFRD